MPSLTPDDARKALWTALRELPSDPSLHPSQIPTFDEMHGSGGHIEGSLPEVFYEHLAWAMGQAELDRLSRVLKEGNWAVDPEWNA